MIGQIIDTLSKEHIESLHEALIYYSMHYINTYKALPPRDAIIAGNNYYFIVDRQYEIVCYKKIDNNFYNADISLMVTTPHMRIARSSPNIWPPEKIMVSLENILQMYQHEFHDNLIQLFPMSPERESEVKELGPQLLKMRDDYDTVISRYGVISVFPFLSKYIKNQPS